MKQDVITALKEMGKTISYFGKEAFWLAVRLTLGVAILAVLVYVIAHYLWYVLSVIVATAIVGWFYIEYITARDIREYEWEQTVNKKAKGIGSGNF